MKDQIGEKTPGKTLIWRMVTAGNPSFRCERRMTEKVSQKHWDYEEELPPTL